jgi:regulator of sigma E protease
VVGCGGARLVTCKGATVLTAAVFLLVLTVSVVVHELAHYFNARMVGVPVRAFSVGMGPVLLRKRWRGTEWRLSLLPLGGYVDLKGLAPEQAEDGTLRYPDEGFMQKSFLQKTWVLIGGVIANFILAVLLLATVMTVEPNAAVRSLVTGEVPSESGTVFQEVLPGTPAEALGIEPGDRVLSFNGVANPSRSEVQQLTRTATALEMVLERAGERITVRSDWPPPDAGDPPRLGVTLAPVEVRPLPPLSFPEAAWRSASFFVRIVPESIAGFARGFGQTFAGQRSAEIVGPVGIVGIAGEAARGGLVAVLTFAGLINFSLALFNALPIPGLDGGRILLAAVVALRGKPFKPGQEEFVNFVGLAFLVLFVVLISFGELGDLFRR